ncbi:hypothetical protein GDO78_005559 [Eleutherodactylus coqui]|uniref:Sodium/nucleoside cotransporter n=1 Tax=Eleutherodactylus coqui TaxID=57060 RepID=A0A8J6FN23_ELECQ|nr:hypothetical protein GDO78_005559 [Eleutherodactylus coqui]
MKLVTCSSSRAAERRPSSGYTAYFIAACVLDFNRAIALVVITCVVLFFFVYDLLVARFAKHIKHFFKPLGQCLEKNRKWMKWVFVALAFIGLIAWLAVDTAKRPTQLISFGGVCMFVILLFIASKHHRAVSWRAVIWGLGLEFVLGIFIIRTEPGYQAFKFLGDQIQALPIVVFFSCVMSILYYVGLMQYIILKISWILQVTMGTTATETLSVAGNIFVGQTEAPLLVRPYLPHMTKSELHAVMTGGFGTIAGSVMGAYISFGIDASSIIAASVMAAPCALALSKLVYPETEESKYKSKDGVRIEKGEERTILEAASNGASTCVSLVANIAANLIAFMALLEFINKAFSWLGGMVNYPELTLQERSEVITTFALCGFANISSIGIMLGGLSTMALERKGDMAKVVVRALMTGACVSFVNACIAGILFTSRDSVDCRQFFGGTEAFGNKTYHLYVCCQDIFGSTVNANGTLSFLNDWETVANATTAFWNCCSFYNKTVCTAEQWI